MRGLRQVASWLLALFLVFMFLQLTLGPLPGAQPGLEMLRDAPGEHLVFEPLSQRTGINWIEPYLRYGVGGLLVLVTVCLLVPPWRRGAAIVAVIVMAAFAAVHLSPELLGREIPVAPNSAETDGGRHFSLVTALLALSLLLIFVHPGRKPEPRRPLGHTSY